ncbi:hypothetical protein MKW94_011628 [Papaver nudicaule]|uniref:MADS-box domain-containing protein n=1 Tax=Papaver nudicaule TaxID=74823 RepID=A0AA41S278_PAPNU|nr:hypothetical protein [Papaver nudicaule]
MARKKVKLAYITNDTSRRATFKKRRKGLLKKVSELSTLCGVSACAIVYGPDDLQPEVWPEQLEATRVLMRFKSLPEMDQNKKQLNQESFMYNRIGKITEQFKKQQRENRYMEINGMFNHAAAGNCSVADVHPSDLTDLAWLLEEKKKEVQRKLSALKKAPASVEQTTDANTSTNAGDANVGGAEGSSTTGGTVTGGCRHHSQGGGINVGVAAGGQERMAPHQMRAAMEALQSQPWFMDVMKPPSIPQPDDQMVNNYLNQLLGGDQNNKNNNQMMMGRGGVSPPALAPSYNGGTLGDAVNNTNAWMMPANNCYVPMNNI